MFKSSLRKIYLSFAIGGALVYCIPVFEFIVRADYTSTWLLYIGNFVFMVVIIFFLFFVSHLKSNNSKTLPLMKQGEKAVFLGTFFACLFSFILLLILIPGIIGHGIAGRQLTNRPANTTYDKTNGLAFMVMINSILGNIFTGSFVCALLPFSLKRNQKTDKVKREIRKIP